MHWFYEGVPPICVGMPIGGHRGIYIGSTAKRNDDGQDGIWHPTSLAGRKPAKYIRSCFPGVVTNRRPRLVIRLFPSLGRSIGCQQQAVGPTRQLAPAGHWQHQAASSTRQRKGLHGASSIRDAALSRQPTCALDHLAHREVVHPS